MNNTKLNFKIDLNKLNPEKNIESNILSGYIELSNDYILDYPKWIEQFDKVDYLKTKVVELLVSDTIESHNTTQIPIETLSWCIFENFVANYYLVDKLIELYPNHFNNIDTNKRYICSEGFVYDDSQCLMDISFDLIESEADENSLNKYIMNRLFRGYIN